MLSGPLPMNTQRNTETPLVPPEFSPLSIARMVWKRKWMILAVFALFSAGTVVYVSQIPAVYKAEAKILVDSQKIPERFVSSTVNSDATERLNYIREQILSSRRLTTVLSEFNLFPAEQWQRTPEEFTERIRRSVTVEADKTSENRGPSMIRLGFKGENQNLVAGVANRLANLFIEENLKTREVMAEGTAEFIDSQLAEAKKNLDNLEAQVSQFKMQHTGELPQQEAQISSALGRLQLTFEANRDAINRNNQTIAGLENSLVVTEAEERIRTQAAQIQSGTLRQDAAPAVPGTTGRIVPAAAARTSEVLAKQLADLRLKYRDGHPEIKRLQAVLDQARKQEAEMDARAAAAAAGTSMPDAPATVTNPTATVAVELDRLNNEATNLHNRDRINSIRAQIAQAKQDIEKRVAEQDQIVKEIALYEGKLQHLPIREQQMAQIMRDYEVSKTSYQGLLNKKLAADMATDMERRQKSERFTLVEPARMPDQPVSPNRLLFDIIGIAIALGVSLVVGLAVEFKKAAFLGDWELPPSTVILAHLPVIELDGHKSGFGTFFRKQGTAMGAATLLILVSAVGFYFLAGR
jgi:polysaccharide biosynthesis transport protein